MRITERKLGQIICVFAIALAVSACRATGGGVGITWGDHHDSHDREHSYPEAQKREGPPAHAPAHGYRAKHRYHYYPSAEVYFDIDRKVYFYLSGSRWTMTATLPNQIRVSLGSEHVTLDMDIDKPYYEHSKHKKKYPPGQAKKGNGNSKGNSGKKRGRDDDD
ncbi:MAG: hypothetical protein OEY67_04250 [Gammaproteobacteria bacterium]|nr:hypothetical protein [Gammaproteobacteria bacterium]